MQFVCTILSKVEVLVTLPCLETKSHLSKCTGEFFFPSVLCLVGRGEQRKLPLGFIEMLVQPVIRLKGDVGHALLYFLT